MAPSAPYEGFEFRGNDYITARGFRGVDAYIVNIDVNYLLETQVL